MRVFSLSDSFTRPANETAYASGDLVANNATAGSVEPMEFTAAVPTTNARTRIRRVRVLKSGTGVTNADFRLHLYDESPTVANGDNGVWSSTASGWLGSFDIGVDHAFSDGAGGVGVPPSGAGDDVPFLLTGTTLYALLEARGAYTPASGETFTVILEVTHD